LIAGVKCRTNATKKTHKNDAREEERNDGGKEENQTARIKASGSKVVGEKEVKGIRNHLERSGKGRVEKSTVEDKPRCLRKQTKGGCATARAKYFEGRKKMEGKRLKTENDSEHLKLCRWGVARRTARKFWRKRKEAREGMWAS